MTTQQFARIRFLARQGQNLRAEVKVLLHIADMRQHFTEAVSDIKDSAKRMAQHNQTCQSDIRHTALSLCAAYGVDYAWAVRCLQHGITFWLKHQSR